MNIKNIITLIFLCKASLIFSAQEPYELYMENYYGSAITCRVNDTHNIVVPSSQGPVRLFYSRTKELTSLVIQSNSYLSALSNSGSLDSYVKQISQEHEQNKGKNAVLVIEPSNSTFSDCFSDWKIRLAWYPQTICVKNFSMETPENEAQTIERQFQTKKISTKDFLLSIEQDNLYGQEYAEKITKLRTLNYNTILKNNSKDTPVYAKLYSFRYDSFLTTVEAIQATYIDYLENPDAVRTQRGNRDPYEVKMLIQELINSRYALFLTYQANGWLDETE